MFISNEQLIKLLVEQICNIKRHILFLQRQNLYQI